MTQPPVRETENAPVTGSYNAMPHPRMNRNCENRRRLLCVGVKAIVLHGCGLLILFMALYYIWGTELVTPRNAVLRTPTERFFCFKSGNPLRSAANILNKPACRFAGYKLLRLLCSLNLPCKERNMAQESTGDRLHVCAAKLAFLTDTISQDTAKVFRLSEPGTYGLYLILSDIETELNNIAEVA